MVMRGFFCWKLRRIIVRSIVCVTFDLMNRKSTVAVMIPWDSVKKVHGKTREPDRIKYSKLNLFSLHMSLCAKKIGQIPRPLWAKKSTNYPPKSGKAGADKKWD